MSDLDQLFANNRRWAERRTADDPDFFRRLAHQQAPAYLWIGCSDSRVPANEIVGLDPGEVFVHRNVANVVVHTDLNCLSVIEFAVAVLHVRHIIVCGHYGCGGVAAAVSGGAHGLIDNWLRHVKDVYDASREELELLADQEERVNRLCELNVRQQVANVCYTTMVQEAWKAGRELAVHGWIYAIADGLLRDLRLDVAGPDQIPEVYRVVE